VTAGRWRARLGLLLLALWAPTTVAVVGLLMVNHTLAMPDPDDLGRLRRGLARLAPAADRRVVHVIGAHCSCTDRLVDHLIARGASPDHPELVVFAGPMRPRHKPLGDAGYRIEHTTPEGLAEQLSIRAAPVLLIEDDGGLRYVGGYFRTPAAAVPVEERLVDAVWQGLAPAPLPIFGCAVEPALRAQLDPLGLQ